jgi:hypothetical protein
VGGISSIYNNIMNGSKKKFIGINQRVPYEVLEKAMDTYIASGSVDKEEILAGIKSVTAGRNRASKAAMYAYQIINRQTKVLGHIAKHYSSLKPLRADERRALGLCLVCLTYPLTYNLLVAMAQGLKVQDVVNKKFITTKISALYGSNATVDIALRAVIPMLIELGVIRRQKIGLYSLGKKLTIRKALLFEIIAYTDATVQGTKSLLLDNLIQKPWYTYFEVDGSDLDKPTVMFERKDNHAGRGYLTLKKI